MGFFSKKLYRKNTIRLLKELLSKPWVKSELVNRTLWKKYPAPCNAPPQEKNILHPKTCSLFSSNSPIIKTYKTKSHQIATKQKD